MCFLFMENKQVETLLFDLFDLSNNCLFWRLHTSSAAKKTTLRALQEFISQETYILAESLSGKYGQINFVGRSSVITKYDINRVLNLADRCSFVDITEPHKSYFIKLGTALYYFYKHLNT